jgi:formate dehydrogenase subunit beta
MGTQWILHTHGDPLGTIRRFLHAIWQQDELDGMLIPIYQVDGVGVEPYLVEEPKRLEVADPLIPFVTENSAKLVDQLAFERPDDRLGVVLRSCEAHALAEKVRRDSLDLGNWLLIGIDCLSSFPIEDLEWRTQKAGTLENLTRQALRFARQGSIAPYRFRQACQMCISPSCENVDLNIELIGLPVKEFILISAKNEATIDRLHFFQITNGPAPNSLRVQHERMLDLLIERRARCRDRKMLVLEDELPSHAAELVALLVNCTPCQNCLEVCPLYTGELTVKGNGGTVLIDEVNSWLASCVACGMCEQSCPKHLPLTAVHCRIGRELRQDHVPFGM